jgi:DNA-binding transcriptional MerR regulator
MAAPAPSWPVVPQKTLFRIGEVSRLTGTKAFVLRYWETEFPTLQPVKSPSGHRLYRRQDIDSVFEIKRLLYEEGFTIAGARKHLADLAAGGPGVISGGNSLSAGSPAHIASSSGFVAEPAAPERVASAAASRAQRKLLLDLREELAAILTLLERE